MVLDGDDDYDERGGLSYTLLLFLRLPISCFPTKRSQSFQPTMRRPCGWVTGLGTVDVWGGSGYDVVLISSPTSSLGNELNF